MHILLVKMSSLGDVVHALPAVNDAYEAGHTFDWVVEESFADVPQMHPGITRVIPIAWRRWRRNLQASWGEMQQFAETLKGQRYDLVLDSQGLLKSAVVAMFARGKRNGYSHKSAREPWSAFFYHSRQLIPPGHAIQRQRELFASALGYNIEGKPAFAGVPQQQASTRDVFLLHGTTWQSKHWPESMWVALVQLVTAAGFNPVVTWGNPVEQDRANKLAEAGASMLPRSSLGTVTERLNQCAAVIGVDSGLTHLSAVLDTPTIGLYGPTDPVLTGCKGSHARTLQGTVHCAPCMRPTCTRYRGDELNWQGEAVVPACLGALTPEYVWEQTVALMRQTADQAI